MANTREVRIHVFERAGLGKAPFRLVNVVERRGPQPIGGPDSSLTVGAPGQPMGSCKFCGEGIADCYVIESADGKRFDVGCVCVGKTGDAGLRKQVDAARRQRDREKRLVRDQANTMWAQEQLRRVEVCVALNAQPYPYQWMADQGHTRLSWAEWMLEHAGAAGRAKVTSYLRKLEVQ